MYRRVVLGVSLVLFGLVAVVAAVVTDVHDRGLPEGLGARAAVALDFSQSDLEGDDAFAALGEVSDADGLGLVRVSPDLAGDRTGQVYVPLGRDHDLPATVPTFGDRPDARVLPADTLTHSFSTGDYLVTGDAADVTAFRTWLAEHRVGAEWTQDGVGATLELVVRETSFATALLAAAVLTVGLVLFWLAVRARGRALRVLAGTPTWRVQVEDLGGFFVHLLLGAVLCGAVATAVVAVTQGTVFVPWFAGVLALLVGVVVAGAALAAVAMSLASWPTAAMLATRTPAAARLGGVATVLQVAVFALLVAGTAPAAGAVAEARQSAAQQATWMALADEVALVFPGALGEEGFVEIMPQVGEVLAAAERDGDAALSVAWESDPAADLDLGATGHLALVDDGWLDLMGRGRDLRADLEPLPAAELPPGAREFLVPSLELWSRDDVPGDQALGRLELYRWTGDEPLPVAQAGGGELLFLDEAVVAVAPELHALFDDSFLSSLASSQNLVLHGVDPTVALVEQHGLEGSVQVKRVAEEGVLRAQYTAWFAWLRGVSLLALATALAVSAAVGALISAMLGARRDFPLRLSGRPWASVVAGRVAWQLLPGIAVTALVVGWQGGAHVGAVLLVAGVALAASPLTQLVAVRWTFANLSLRRP